MTQAVTPATSEARIQTYAEFWPFYMREHSSAANRRMHFVGTTLAFACLATAIVTRRWGLLAAAPLCGYGFAWVGHFFVEKNRPATFKYPLWSLISDFRLWGLMLRGKAW